MAHGALPAFLGLVRSPVMREMPSIQLVKTWYVTSFQELRTVPVPNTVAKEAEFAK